MTRRWEQEDLDAKLAENPELSVDTRGNPLPRLAQAIQHREQRSKQEEEFLEKIIILAHLHHWKVAHFRPAKTEKGWRTAVSADGKGFPDLVLARNGVVICAEVKSEAGKLSSAQREWITELGTLSVGVWRPSDWDRIIEILS